MPRLKKCPPKYRLHKASGRATVTIERRDHYLGPFGSPESHEKYQAIVAQWAARQNDPTPLAASLPGPMSEVRVCELVLAYMKFANGYYRKNGQATGELSNLKEAARPLVKLFETERVAKFGPRKLKAVRDAMVASDLSRGVVNARVNRIRRIIRWGVENELVDPAVLQALQAVAPLKRGRSAARETERVRPVRDEHIAAVRETVTPQIRAMIDVQRLSGMRPGEVVLMRPCDIGRDGTVWIYRPTSHKTEHHDIERRVFLGPQAQRVLEPFLGRNDSAYLFDPREAILNSRRDQRKRSKNPTVRARKKLNLRSLRRISDHYTTKTYARAIHAACKRAGIRSWGPNRLRHNAATFLREQFGIEEARVILGHTSAAMTEVYAEMDRSKAADIMMQVG